VKLDPDVSAILREPGSGQAPVTARLPPRMDDAKIALVFGTVPEWADPDDEDDRAQLLADQIDTGSGPVGAFRSAAYEVIANQIAGDDPPFVWETAQRLRAEGLDREDVLRNLVLALLPQLQAAVTDKVPFNRAAYAASLDRLPLPTFEDLAQALVGITRERQPIAIDDLESRTMSSFGLPVDEEPYRSLLDNVMDAIVDPDGLLEYLAGNLVVEPASLCGNAVLTHRLTEAERATDSLVIDTDLPGFARREDPIRTADGDEVHTDLLDGGGLCWHGPDGWLERFDAGDLLAVRVLGDAVAIGVLESEPLPEPGLVQRLRAAYDLEVEEPELPISTEDILLRMLATDRGTFAAPQPPLSELCRAAGLEVRGNVVAHDESIWANERLLHRFHRVADRLEERDDRLAALDALDRFDDLSEDRRALRRALSTLRSPDILEVVSSEMLGPDDDPDRLELTHAFAERLSRAAGRPSEVAVARWLAAVVSERRADPLTALGHLRAAVEADPQWGPAVDRLAWYRSDQGDAAEAARLWRRLGVGPEVNQDLAKVESFVGSPGGVAKLGRNEPCWCGSGRKFKACHLDRPAAISLPDRVGWLCRKAGAYLERRGGAPAREVIELAMMRAEDDSEEAVAEALADPLVIDIALHEMGWFDRFLAERGPLLPQDEALLAASWTLVDRSVFEVAEIAPGEGVVVQDLRTAEPVQVRERTFSRTATPGMLICARAVPDGQAHQFIGGVFTVTPGTEGPLLDLLDRGDPFELVEHLTAIEQPPAMRTREDEPIVSCEAVVEVPDAGATRRLLDLHYRSDDQPNAWVEMHTLDNGDDILRATITLDGRRLTVETMSEERMDRVLSVIFDRIEGAVLAEDERRPFDPRMLSRAAPPSTPPVIADHPELLAHLEEWRDRMEVRWCDESIPALAGFTPREAAADPTRRESLERLLASFDRHGPDVPGSVTMRPARLRELLGLVGIGG
jgi:SEC-C motif